MNFVIKKSLFVLLLVYTVSAFSQNADKTLEFEKKIKGNSSIKIDFITDSSNSKIAILSHFEKKSTVHLLDSSLQEIDQFEVPTREKAFFKGGVFRGDSLLFCFFTDTYKETILTTCHYSQSKKTLTQQTTDVTFYNENALEAFISGDKIFILTAKNGVATLNLHSFNLSGEKRNTKTYSFNSIVSTVTNKPVSSFFPLDERRPALVRNIFEPDFTTAIKAQRKIYLTSDSLYIVANSDVAITEIFSLSLNNNGQSYRSIYHHSALGIIKSDGKKAKDNSFLCNRLLFYTIVSPDSLRFVVTDFVTGNELQSFVIGRKDSIYFRNSPLKRYGSDPKDILGLLYMSESTSNLFNAIFKGNLFVYAEERTEGYEVMMGAYKRYTEKSAITSPASPITAGIGSSSPVIYSTEEKEEIFEFTTVIDKLGNSYLNSTIYKSKSIRQKKLEIAKKKKVDMFELRYAKVGAQEFFLYYNNFRKHLKLYKSEAVN